MQLKNILIYLVFAVVIFSTTSFAWKMDPEFNYTVHQWITNQSYYIWTDMPVEFRYYFINPITFRDLDHDGYTPSRNDDIIVGSAEEDLLFIYGDNRVLHWIETDV